MQVAGARALQSPGEGLQVGTAQATPACPCGLPVPARPSVRARVPAPPAPFCLPHSNPHVRGSSWSVFKGRRVTDGSGPHFPLRGLVFV